MKKLLVLFAVVMLLSCNVAMAGGLVQLSDYRSLYDIVQKANEYSVRVDKENRYSHYISTSFQKYNGTIVPYTTTYYSANNENGIYVLGSVNDAGKVSALTVVVDKARGWETAAEVSFRLLDATDELLFIVVAHEACFNAVRNCTSSTLMTAGLGKVFVVTGTKDDQGNPVVSIVARELL